MELKSGRFRENLDSFDDQRNLLWVLEEDGGIICLIFIPNTFKGSMFDDSTSKINSNGEQGAASSYTRLTSNLLQVPCGRETRLFISLYDMSIIFINLEPKPKYSNTFNRNGRSTESKALEKSKKRKTII